MTTTYNTKEQVFTKANLILNRTLRDVIPPDEINTVEIEVNRYANRRKGFLGELVERFVFGLDVNSRPEADFNIAGVELKTNPLKRHSDKKYVSKERLVFSMINYNEIVKETWETSSFLKKNNLLLLMFYLWLKDQNILDHEFKFVHLLDLLKDISDADALQIKKDWEFIVAKIQRGEAHLLSEADTYFLGACTKAANSRVVRDQPRGGRIPAKPRAFSLKQQYLNYLIQKQLLKRDVTTDSILKRNQKAVTVEQMVFTKFAPYFGMTDSEIQIKIGVQIGKSAKNYKRMLANRILGVTSNRIEELEKSNVTLKVVTLEYSGTLKESLSFPAFDYKDLVTQVWYDEEAEDMSELYEQIETKKFLFVVFRKIKGSEDIILEKIKFWNFPMADLPEVQRVWEKTVKSISDGEYKSLPKISDSPVAHVRPHGNNAQDTLETPQGTYEVKRCFWLNAKYIQRILEQK
jgi:DNA mismatch repair protein MutH